MGDLRTLTEAALHVGFTGTRKGMTEPQRQSVWRVLEDLDGDAFHHGDCDGADAEADGLARATGYTIHIHPPTDSRFRAFCAMRHVGDILWKTQTYLKRNHEIVDATVPLIATPGEMTEQLRSGTWSTIRQARKRGKRVIIIFPDGSVSDSAAGGPRD